MQREVNKQNKNKGMARETRELCYVYVGGHATGGPGAAAGAGKTGLIPAVEPSVVLQTSMHEAASGRSVAWPKCEVIVVLGGSGGGLEGVCVWLWV